MITRASTAAKAAPYTGWIVQRLLLLGALSAGVLATFAGPAAATTWTVVTDASTIGFSGAHAGRPFDGRFTQWQADITFDPENLDAASAVVRVDLTSASTGDRTYDKTLPSKDWFQTDTSATATFETQTFRKTGGSTFEADGPLTLRQIEVPVTLAFTFEEVDGTATIKGSAKLKRLDWQIGEKSDAAGSWVSLDIPITIDVTLKRAGP